MSKTAGVPSRPPSTGFPTGGGGSGAAGDRQAKRPSVAGQGLGARSQVQHGARVGPGRAGRLPWDAGRGWHLAWEPATATWHC